MSLRVEQDGRLCRIAFAIPEKRNVLDAEACRALLREIIDAAAADQTGAILLEADGPVFCAGAEPDSGDLFTIRERIAKPIVAAVQGVAISGGLALVANAHVAIAAQGTSFGLTDIREGKWSPVIFRAIANAVGDRRAMELGLTGRVFSTPDALAWGLVHSVAPAFELDDRATEIATALANANPAAVREALSRTDRQG
ncbi:MAG: enoyl-CoA hydratase/isomerase family protein [Acidobacteriia bacterium]|nr:enoyl-CoA hydratase/isomerase family protein [Terriglobia bacterium]